MPFEIFATRLFSQLSLMFLITAVVGCGDGVPLSTDPEELGRCANFDELRRPLFGDTHIHTDLSLDANLQATRSTPDDAYRFAKGATLGVQPYDVAGNPLRMLRIDRPLDFAMVSDHAEFLGTVASCQDPSSPAYDTEECILFRGDPAGAFLVINVGLIEPQDEATYPELCGEDGSVCLQSGMDVWGEVRAAAETAYDRSPSCTFTSLVGYEWSAQPNLSNLHRNVVFRNGIVPDRVTSYFDAHYPEDLWSSLRSECMEGLPNCDVLAIPHNSNVGLGDMYRNITKGGNPFDTEYAAERAQMEPLVEVFQHKGASECMPGQLTSDEFCGFELMPFRDLAATNLCVITKPVPSDFVREALGVGMALESELGVNPFKQGFIASTDTHIAASGAVDEKKFLGHGGAGQANRDVPEDTSLPPVPALPDIMYLNPGGLAGVWAEENSREAIFLAMRRKETFGTSGPRIVVRFFGGWDYPEDICDSVDSVKTGYDNGVPMGATLGARPSGSDAPVFFVSALQDPGTAQSSGVPLQRIQIVKGFINDEGEFRVQTYDLNDDHANGATVDLSTCELQGTGHSALCERWQDPDFDPAQRAYYYARVLENPSCRWTTRICVDAAVDCDNRTTPLDEACCDPVLGLNDSFCQETVVDCPDDIDGTGCAFPLGATVTPERCCLPKVEPAIQERAWSSPIWYTP